MKNATAAQSTFIWQWASFDSTIRERGREKKKGKKKKAFYKAKKEANCALLTAGPLGGIEYREEAGIIQETAVAGL